MTRLLLLLLPALAQPFRRKMVEESSPACPGSPSPRHAKCSLRIEFEQPCAEVQAEVVARLRGGQGWRCPKTHPGQYTLISASAGAVRGSRETGPGSTPGAWQKLHGQLRLHVRRACARRCWVHGARVLGEPGPERVRLQHQLLQRAQSVLQLGRGLQGVAARADLEGAVWRLVLPRAKMQGQPQGRA